MPDTSQVLQPGVTGQDLRLTIDAGLQLSLEQEVMAAGVADRAPSVSAVVMDPYTGEVYAEATYPSYDANDYRAVAAKDPGTFVDPVVSSVYEPGSVFKVFTALAGFENDVVTPNSPIKDTGSLRLDGGRITIYDSDKRAMGASRCVLPARPGMPRRSWPGRGRRSALADRPGSTWPAKCPASCATPPSSPGTR